MKWLFLGIGAAAAIVGITAALKAAVKAYRGNIHEECVDGGVRHYTSGEDAPKVINSAEITEFRCEFSLFAHAEPDELGNGLYDLTAALRDDTVMCVIKIRKRTNGGGERNFVADISFMEKLQEIISAYDFAKHNGYSYSISGLPDMYGCVLDVRYASGEYIHAYDNQNVFLPHEALKALYKLFDDHSKNNNTNMEE